MSNPVLNMLNQRSGPTNNSAQAQAIRQMAGALKSGNPTRMLNGMAQSNPALKQIMGMVNSGGNPKQMFYDMARRKGIDPESIVSLLK